MRPSYADVGEEAESYGAFFGFAARSIVAVWMLTILWLSVGTLIETGSLTTLFAGVALSLVFGLGCALFFLAIAATLGWAIWRLCFAARLPLWSAVTFVALLGALALAFAVSRFALPVGGIGQGRSDGLKVILALATRMAIVSVPVGLFMARRTYGRLT